MKILTRLQRGYVCTSCLAGSRCCRLGNGAVTGSWGWHWGLTGMEERLAGCLQAHGVCARGAGPAPDGRCPAPARGKVMPQPHGASAPILKSIKRPCLWECLALCCRVVSRCVKCQMRPGCLSIARYLRLGPNSPSCSHRSATCPWCVCVHGHVQRAHAACPACTGARSSGESRTRLRSQSTRGKSLLSDH